MQQPNKRGAEEGIAQVSDVGGLVGVNTGVLDQNLACWNIDLRFFIGSESAGKLFGLDPGIDVASPGKLQLLKTIDQPNAGQDFFSNLPGWLAQLLGQFKGKGQSILAEFDPGRLLDHNLRQVEIVAAAQKVAYLLGKPVFQMTVQESL